MGDTSRSCSWWSAWSSRNREESAYKEVGSMFINVSQVLLTPKSEQGTQVNDQHCHENIPRLDSCRTDGGTEASSGANSAPLSPEILERVEELVVGTRPGSPAQEESLPPTPALLRFDPTVFKISFHPIFPSVLQPLQRPRHRLLLFKHQPRQYLRP